MSNVQVEYFIFCENVINGERAKQTIVNTFDQIYAPKLPSIQGLLSIASKITFKQPPKKSDVFIITVNISNPSGKNIGKIELDPIKDMDSTSTGITLAINANGMPMNEYGTYEFDLILNEEKIASRSIEVLERPRDVKP